MTTATKNKPNAAPVAARGATNDPKARICAFCGLTKAEAKEPTLPCEPYIGALPVAPPFDSAFAHLSCVRAHRERDLQSASSSPRTPKRGKRATTPTVAAVPAVSWSDALDAPEDASVHVLGSVRMRRIAAHALGLSLPNAGWGHATCTIHGTEAKGYAVVRAPLWVLHRLGAVAREMVDGRMAMHPHNEPRPGVARRAVRKCVTSLTGATATPAAGTTSAFTF